MRARPKDTVGGAAGAEAGWGGVLRAAMAATGDRAHKSNPTAHEVARDFTDEKPNIRPLFRRRSRVDGIKKVYIINR